MSPMRLFILAVFGLLPIYCYTQIQYRPVASALLDASVCWNVSVTLSSGPERVQLFGKILDESGNLVLEAQSDVLQLNNGRNVVDKTSVRTANIKFHSANHKEYLQRYGQLPAGRYQFCTAAKTLSTNEEIGEDCTFLSQGIQSAVPSEQGKVNKTVDLFGNAGVEHVVASRQGTNQNIPSNVVRMQAQPGFSIATIPFTANAYYTTERSALLPDQFALSVDFDRDRFRKNLQSVVEKKLLSELQLNRADLLKKQQWTSELTQIDSKLRSAANMADIGTLQSQLDNLNPDELDAEAAKMAALSAKAMQSLDYTNEKSKIEDVRNQVAIYMPRDSIEEARKKVILDSLDRRSRQLDHQKDSLILALNGGVNRMDSLRAKLNEVEELKRKISVVQESAELTQELMQRKEVLVQLMDVFDKGRAGAGDALKSASDNLKDPANLREMLISQGMFTGSNKLLFGLRQFSIGTVYPSYSPLVLNGVQIHGGALEIQPKGFYLNVTGGNLHLGVPLSTNETSPSYQRPIVAGRIGFGRMESTYLHFSYVHIFDNATSLPSVLANGIDPSQNDVTSGTLNLEVWKNRINLFAEVAASGFNRNRNDEVIPFENPTYERFPDFLKPTLSSSYDIAYTLRGDLKLWKGSDIRIYQDYIGPGYVSLGVPFLRNDVIRRGFRADQSFWKNRLRANINYRTESDNIYDNKGSTSEAEFYGGGIMLIYKKLPSIKLDYLNNVRSFSGADFKMNRYSLNSSWNYSIATLKLRSGLNYQFVSGNADSLSSLDYKLNNMMVVQNVSFRKPITLMFTAGRNTILTTDHLNEQWQFGAGVMGTPVKKLSCGVSVDMVKNETGESRFSVSSDIAWQIGKRINLTTNFRLNQFNDFLMESLGGQLPGEEYIVTSKLSFVW